MIKGINILGFYVTNLVATIDFYTKLGFQKTRSDAVTVEFAFESMRLQFMDKQESKKQGKQFEEEAFGEPKGIGLYINIEVENIDEYYKSLKDKGLTPSTQPRDWPWGHREFVIRDPDRYKLVIYQKLK
ncbi:MAG: VOC family protein [Patescibacteria group bacterium]